MDDLSPDLKLPTIFVSQKTRTPLEKPCSQARCCPEIRNQTWKLGANMFGSLRGSWAHIDGDIILLKTTKHWKGHVWSNHVHHSSSIFSPSTTRSSGNKLANQNMYWPTYKHLLRNFVKVSLLNFVSKCLFSFFVFVLPKSPAADQNLPNTSKLGKLLFHRLPQGGVPFQQTHGSFPCVIFYMAKKNESGKEPGVQVFVGHWGVTPMNVLSGNCWSFNVGFVVTHMA